MALFQTEWIKTKRVHKTLAGCYRACEQPFVGPDESQRDAILGSTMYPKKAVESRRDGIVHSVYRSAYHVDRSTICRPSGTRIILWAAMIYLK